MKIKSFIPGIAWFFFTAVLLFLPGQDLPDTDDWMAAIYFDKWVHAGIFGMLVLSFIYPVYRLRGNDEFYRRWRFYVMAAVAGWAFITECIQYYFIPGRQFDVFDIAADLTGASLALVFSYIFFKKRTIGL
ncbi:MAG: VanZ family protein [Ferruginibacter sp.]